MVGQRIRYYRKTKGLTQEELAQGICSVSYLSKIEKGDAKSSEEVINLLCERLGISPEEVDSDEIIELLDEWNMMMVSRRFDEADEFIEVIQKKMEHVNEPELIIRYELFLARYCLTRMEPDIETAHKLLLKIKNIKEQISIELSFYYFIVWGMYYTNKREFNHSVESYMKAEELYKLNPKISSSDVAVLYYLLALAYSYLLRISSVNNYAYKAITIFDKEYNYSRSADCQILLAISFRRAQNYEQAEYHLKQALKYSQSFKDKLTSGIIYHNLGYVNACKKQHNQAIEYFKKSLQFKKDYSAIRMCPTILLLAEECYKLGDIEQAKEWLQKAFSYLGDNTTSDVYYHLKILEFRLGTVHSQEFETFMSKNAIPYFEKNNMWEYVSTYSELLADSYFDQGQYKKSSQYYRIANNSRKNIY